MAIADEIRNAARDFAGREATESDLSGAAGLSVGQLGDFFRGGGSSGGGGGSSFDSALEIARRAAAPAIDTLRGQAPRIAEIFSGKQERIEGEFEPTRQRYERLLGEVAQGREQATERQTLTTSRELGRRGVTGGLAERELTQALNPITQFFTGKALEVGEQEQGALRGLQNLIGELGGQQTSQEIALQQAIAQLQAGAGPQALGIFQSQQQSQQSVAAQALQQQIADQNAQIAQQQFGLQEQQFPLQQDLLRAQIANQQRLAGGGGGLTAADFLSQMGGGQGGAPAAPPPPPSNAFDFGAFGLEPTQTGSAQTRSQGF